MTNRRLLPAIALLLAVTTAACSGGGDDRPPAPSTGSGVDASTFAAEVASTDLAVNRPERVEVGVFSSTSDSGVQLLTFGKVQLAFTYLGSDGSATPQPGPTVIAAYLPAPGTDANGTTPTLMSPDQARGVYQAEDVTFDHAGIWTVAVSTDIQDLGSLSLDSTFSVKPKPSLPAPGDEALATKNLTIGSKGVDPVSIDSRAQGDQPIPDPQLHRWTIADALKQGRPALVLFATPVYCISRFCGPDTDALAGLAKAYPDRAVYIHIEIWKDFDHSVANQAAVDWLYRDGDLTEPWLYLIGANGMILDRWGPVFDADEVAAELADLPAMKS